jgi:hypothetical protein
MDKNLHKNFKCLKKVCTFIKSIYAYIQGGTKTYCASKKRVMHLRDGVHYS